MLDLPYVECLTVKGRDYYYYRRGKNRTRLPHMADKDFSAKYAAVHARFETTDAPQISGEFSDLIIAYKATPHFKELAKSTRRDYSWHLDRLRIEFGDARLSEVTRGVVLAYKDALGAKPRQAAYAMQVMRLLFNFAEDRGLMPMGQNPARRPGQSKSMGGHKAWPQASIDKYLEAHKSDPDRLLALALGLFAAQRRGDVIRRNKADWNGTEIVAVAHKNGEPLWIPALPPLKALLEQIMPKRFMMLTTKTGRPFTERSFSRWFAEGLEKAGLQGLTFHGLRTTAAEVLAEFCDDATMQAIFGWRSSTMAAHYRRGANKRRLALIGMTRWEQKLAELPNSAAKVPK